VFAGLAKIIFAMYSNLEQYLHPQNDASDPLNDVQYKRGPVAPVSRRQYPTTDRNHIEWQPDDRIYYNKEDQEEEQPKVVGTKIISASVGERNAEKVSLKEPVIYTLEHKSVTDCCNVIIVFSILSQHLMMLVFVSLRFVLRLVAWEP